MLQRRDRIDELGAAVVVVVHDEPERIREGLLEGLDVPYPVIVDVDRSAYRAWGLRRANPLRIYLDPAVWRAYARLLRGGGERLRPAGRDTLQLGGDFVVGSDGRLVYSRPQRADDRPPVGTLLAALKEAAARRAR